MSGMIPLAVLRLLKAQCRHPLFRLAGFKQGTNFLDQRRVSSALGSNQFFPHFFSSRERLVEDRLNPQETFRRLVHLSSNPARGW